MNCAPVLITVYHRLYTLRRCVEALLRNKEACDTCLYIASDAPCRDEDKNLIDAVRSYVKTITGFKSVVLIARGRNFGQHDNCEDAINRVLNEHGRVIFLEDDILASPTYLSYSNAGLEAFKDNDRVFAVCGYNSAVQVPKGWKPKWYALRRYSPWGVAFWRNKWRNVNLSRGGRVSSLMAERPDDYHRLCNEDPAFIRLMEADDNGSVTAMDVRIESYLLHSGMCCVYPKKAQTTFMSTGKDAMHFSIAWIKKPRLECDEFVVEDFKFGNLNQEIEIYKELLNRKYPKRVERMINALRNDGCVATLVYCVRRLLQEVVRK